MNPRPRILILDDEEGPRTAIKMLLALDGMDSTAAATSDEALALAEREKSDLITSDISHPGLDGLALLPVWRQQHPHVPVVIISAGIGLYGEKRILQMGAAACLAKPFNLEGLRAAIQTGLAARPPISDL